MSSKGSHRDEEGITLVEVLVFLFISVLFLTLLSVLFSNGLGVQQRTTARDNATGRALVISSSLQSSLRNATEVAVDGTGRRVDAVVFAPGGGIECRAWVLEAGGAVRYSAGPEARGDDVGTWKALIDGARGTLPAGAAFAAVGVHGLEIGIAVTVAEETAHVADGVTAQAFSSGEDAPACW